MKKILQLLKKCPLVCMIIISICGITIYAFVGMLNGKYEMNISLKHPMFNAVLFKEYKIEDKMSESTILVENTEDEKKEPMKETEEKEDKEDKEEQEPEENPAVDGYETVFITGEMRRAKSGYYSDNDKTALSTDYPYQKVDDSYFEEAVFIGDSRIEGFSDYSGIKGDCFYKEGLTVYRMFEDKVNSRKGKSTMLKTALKKKQYKNIYIMIGINELGYKTTDKFKEKYEENLEIIKELQPDARIIIMGIMRVTTAYSEKSKVFNNDNIEDKNCAIAELADGKRIFYLDMNPAVTDDDGGIIEEYTWDGVHLKAEYYALWADFMKEHGYEENTIEP